MKVGEIHKTNKSGLLEVIRYDSFKDITVRFLSTGFEVKTQGGQISSGRVKDRLAPIMYGVGFIGVGNYPSGHKGVNSPAYESWRNMIKRCYCKKFLSKNKTYVGVTVCNEWLDFQVFAGWFYKNKPDDGLSYDLDKDIKSTGVKTYSPETCSFVNRQVNNEKALAKSYSLISPCGEVVNIFNMSKFCRENNLKHSGMFEMVRGKNKTYKGWALNE